MKPEPITYLTAEELAQRIKFAPRVINTQLKDAVLIEGVHYIRPFGRRKVLYIWEAVDRTLREQLNAPSANSSSR